jgi:hypothetical protein
VGVDVDEARCDHLAGGIELASDAAPDRFFDRDDTVTNDADISSARRCSRPVYDHATANDKV